MKSTPSIARAYMDVLREEERKRVAKGTARYGHVRYEVRSCRAAMIESCDGIEN